MAGYLVPFATIAVFVIVMETLRHFSFSGVSFALPEEDFIRVSTPVVLVTLEVGMNAFKAVFVYFIKVSHCRCSSAIPEKAVSVIRPTSQRAEALYIISTV